MVFVTDDQLQSLTQPTPEPASDQSGNTWDSSTQSWLDPNSGQHWSAGTGWTTGNATEQQYGPPTPSSQPDWNAMFAPAPSPSPSYGLNYGAANANPDTYSGPVITDYNGQGYQGQSHPGDMGQPDTSWLDALKSGVSDVGNAARSGLTWLQEHNPNAGFGIGAMGSEGTQAQARDQFGSMGTPASTYFKAAQATQQSLLPPSVTADLPDQWYFPAKQIVEGATSPLGIALAPVGGDALLPTIGRNTIALAGGVAAQEGANKALPQDMNPILRTGLTTAAGLAGGVAGYESPAILRKGAGAAVGAAKAYSESPLASESGSLTLGRKPALGPAEGPAMTSRALPEAVDLGDAGARSAIALKEATTREAGPIGEAVGKIPGVKKVAGIVTPSINLERPIHVANQAEAAVKADLVTQLAATRKPLIDEIRAAGLDGGKNAPEYIGPAARPKSIVGTFLDIAENPQDYRLSPMQSDLIQRVAARDAANVNLVRGQYGADVGLYKPANEGAAYVPHINANEEIVAQSARAEASLTNPRIAKERVWDTAAARMASDPKFTPETSAARLLEAHDNALANMAGKNTFAIGSGGLNKAEVMAQVAPGLAKRMDALNSKLASMKGTAGRLDTKVNDAIDTFLKSGKTDDDLLALQDSLHPAVGKNAVGKVGPNFGKDRVALNADIAQVKAQLTDLRPKWKNFNLQDRGYEMSPVTYKYHSPETVKSIAAVKQLSNGPIVDATTNVLDTWRSTALNLDTSPLTIQGTLSAFAHPFSAAKSIVKMLHEGSTLDTVTRTEPETVARYTRATGRALGDVSPEFSVNRSLAAKIPGIAKADSALYSVVQRMQYEAWKSSAALYQKLYPKLSQDVIDHEIANSLSKVVPSLSTVERGVSPARAKIERAAFTSTSFATAPALMAKDAASAVAKIMTLQPTKIRPRELLALQHVVTIAATVEGISLASAVANADNRGLSVEDAIKKALTPGDRTFMSIQFGGKTLPLGGPFRSTINGLTPRYYNGKWEPPNLIRFAQSKLSPGVGTGIDLLRNQDYYGNKIIKGDPLEQLGRVVGYLGENLLPLTAGAAAEGLRTGRGLGETLQNAGSQALGSNVNSASQREQLDVISRKMFGADYANLDPLQRQQAKDATGYASTNPDAVKSATDTAALREQNVARQQSIDAQGPGKNWRDDYQKMEQRIAGQYDAKNTIDPYTGKPYGSAMDQAIAAWSAVMDKAQPGVDTDYSQVDAWRAANPEQAKLVDKYMADKKVTDLTPMVTEYKQASKALTDTGYFDLRDKLWQKLNTQSPVPGYQPGQGYYDWKAALVQQTTKEMIAAGIDQTIAPTKAQTAVDTKYPVVTRFNELYKPELYQWVDKHPAEARKAIEWGYLTPDKKISAFMQSGAGR